MNRKMYLRYGLPTGLGIIIVVCLTVIYLHRVNPSHSVPSGSADTQTGQVADNQTASSLVENRIHLYFVDKDKPYLVSEERTIAPFKDPDANMIRVGEAILEALIQGPESDLTPTIPKGTRLNGFFITEDGNAYVDLTPDAAMKHPGGSETELLTIYSIVNSLILNVSPIKTVKILIDGEDALTLAGHIDLRLPFKANMLLVR